MILTEVALEKLTKKKIIKVTFDYQDNFNQDYITKTENIKRDLSQLRENFSKPESELAVAKQVNNVLRLPNRSS